MNTASLLPAAFHGRLEFTSGGCWVFLGATQTRGYGSVAIGGGRSGLAHRVAYEALVGPIPAGLTLDHLCEVKRCVNPTHLEPVTRAENVRRHAERHRGSHYCDQLHCPRCQIRIANSDTVRRSKERARRRAAA